MTDAINPAHYQFSNGAQAIDISENLSGNGAQIVQYTARATRLDGNIKGNPIEDLQKVLWFTAREILRLGGTYDVNSLPKPDEVEGPPEGEGESKPLVVLPPETVLFEVTGPLVFMGDDDGVDLAKGDIVHILEPEDHDGDVFVEVIAGSERGKRQYIAKTSLTPTFDVRR